jgi:hypothetical protein
MYVDRPGQCRFDQPYIVYHTIQRNMMDNQSLKRVAKLATETDQHVARFRDQSPGTCLIHFPGGVGGWRHKKERMRGFLFSMR